MSSEADGGAEVVDVIKDRVRAQFGAAAEDYVHSVTHAQGDDLGLLVQYAAPEPSDVALDIATGGGHTALALAPHVRRVVATDLTPAMLEAAARFIRGEGRTNVSFELADAEALPFEAASFDIVTTRIAPHHFADVRAYLGEVARVLRPEGRFVLIDNVAPPDAALAAFVDEIERERDPSHVHCLSAREWETMIGAAGLTVQRYATARRRIMFADWTARMRLPAAETRALEAKLLAAPEDVREYLRVEREADHVVAWSSEYIVLLATKGLSHEL